MKRIIVLSFFFFFALSFAASLAEEPLPSSLTVTGIQPDKIDPSLSLDSTNFIIQGTGFQKGLTLDLGPGISIDKNKFLLGGYPGYEFDEKYAQKFAAAVNISPSATPGFRNVKVTNPDGASFTAENILFIDYVTPEIISISPNKVNQGQNSTNSYFLQKQLIVLECKGVLKDFDIDFGAGINHEKISIPLGAYSSATDTYSVHTVLLVDDNAAVGPRKVIAKNPNGLSSEFPSGIEVLPTKFLSKVTPSLLYPGDLKDFTVEISNGVFAPDSSPKLESCSLLDPSQDKFYQAATAFGGGAAPPATIGPDYKKITFPIVVPMDIWITENSVDFDIAVTCGGEKYYGKKMVQAKNPSLSGISLAEGKQGQVIQGVEANGIGTHFNKDTYVFFSNSDNGKIYSLNPIALSPTKLTFDIVIKDNAPLGKKDVHVVTPKLPYGTPGGKEEHLTIYQAFNVLKKEGGNITPPPSISVVGRANIKSGQTKKIKIKGENTNFQQSATKIDCGVPLTVVPGSLKVLDKNNLEVTITASPFAYQQKESKWAKITIKTSLSMTSDEIVTKEQAILVTP